MLTLKHVKCVLKYNMSNIIMYVYEYIIVTLKLTFCEYNNNFTIISVLWVKTKISDERNNYQKC